MSHPSGAFEALLRGAEPVLALAPMQDVTDLAFWQLMARYGGPDVYYTEYFRVHAVSRLEKSILRSITDNATGCPVVAQIIGNDIPALVRAARELEQYPVAAVDFNLGCPAPVVYRKGAGGGLLREPARIDAILGALRQAITGKFTVKTRLGFDSPEECVRLLPVFARHSLDLLTVHGRTVRGMYDSEVHYDYIRQAVQSLPCPVLANGNIYAARQAEAVLRETGARGLMIGRGAIRNPWIFRQIRQSRSGASMDQPAGRDVLQYIERLYEAVCSPAARESAQVKRLKKFVNYIGTGVDSGGRFLHQIRRADTRAEFFRVCRAFLDHDRPMALEPFDQEEQSPRQP